MSIQRNLRKHSDHRQATEPNLNETGRYQQWTDLGWRQASGLHEKGGASYFSISYQLFIRKQYWICHAKISNGKRLKPLEHIRHPIIWGDSVSQTAWEFNKHPRISSEPLLWEACDLSKLFIVKRNIILPQKMQWRLGRNCLPGWNPHYRFHCVQVHVQLLQPNALQKLLDA